MEKVWDVAWALEPEPRTGRGGGASMGEVWDVAWALSWAQDVVQELEKQPAGETAALLAETLEITAAWARKRAPVWATAKS